ncbi:hypothetical protein JCM8097_007786 [Rhodosporidiobolus ruineniae]
MSTLSLCDGLRGQFGSIGLYSAVQRCFVAFAPFAFFGSLGITAPFGRFIEGPSRWTVNGRWGWMLSEILSPLCLLYFAAAPLSTTSYTFALPSPSHLVTSLTHLPPARKLLLFLYVAHYSNRAVVSELRNPGRSPMSFVIPLFTVPWNLTNGSLMGFWLGGGASGRAYTDYGIAGSKRLFVLGIAIWLAGFVSNIYHDEVLFRLKRAKMDERAKQEKEKPGSAPSSAKDRYAIPQGGLYHLVSHPSYFSEWCEWSGFALAALQLASAPFPPSASSPILRALPSVLRPLQHWYLQPPALFVLQEIACMLPRARSGHSWYKKTFGEEWKKKGARWAVVPGVY